jgi:hypothetical protein
VLYAINGVGLSIGAERSPMATLIHDIDSSKLRANTSHIPEWVAIMSLHIVAPRQNGKAVRGRRNVYAQASRFGSIAPRVSLETFVIRNPSSGQSRSIHWVLSYVLFLIAVTQYEGQK